MTATCERSSDVVRYQLGRLMGYLVLGVSAGILGSGLNLGSMSPVLPSLFIGLLFIYWGMKGLTGKRVEIPIPKFLRKIYSGLWLRLVHKNNSIMKSFFTGLISILLPCGLLYGVVLGTVALQHTTDAIMAMFFFWLGTVPSMVVAPSIIQKVLRPLKAKLPKTYAISLMAVGVMTISFRLVNFYAKAPVPSAEAAPQEKGHSCH